MAAGCTVREGIDVMCTLGKPINPSTTPTRVTSEVSTSSSVAHSTQPDAPTVRKAITTVGGDFSATLLPSAHTTNAVFKLSDTVLSTIVTPSLETLAVALPSASPSATIPISITISTSVGSSSSTSELEVVNIPATSHTLPNVTGTSSHPPPSSSGDPKPLATSATNSVPSRRFRLPTAALAGIISCVLLVLAASAALVCLWVRRRRARAPPALPLAQNSATRMSTSDVLPSVSSVPPGSHVASSCHRNDGVTESSTRSHPLLSNKSHSDSAPNLELEPSSQSPTIYTDHKHCGFYGEEESATLTSFSASPSTEHLSDRTDSPPSWDAAPLYTPVPSALETAGTQGDRHLHLALPWVFGQRVLAMMAGEDARSVESGGSEPLPAYEPRE